MFTQISLETRYILYRVFTNVTFFSVVWLYFYRIYIDDGQIGLLDGIAFFIGLLFEIPSGAFSDAIGRKKIVKLGQFLVVIGILIQVVFPEFWTFVIGQSILVVGLSFASGSDDALFYSALRYNPESTNWKKLVTRASKWTLAASLFATITWAYLHTIDPTYPWYLTALLTSFSLFILSGVVDTGSYVNSHLFRTIKNIYNSTLSGIRNFHHKGILVYIPIILWFQALYYAYWYWILRIILLERFHFSPFLWSIAMGSIILVSIWFLHRLEKNMEHIVEKQIFYSLWIITIFSLILAIWDIGYWWWITLLILYVGQRIIHPFVSDGLNKHAPEKERATILSVGSFLKSIPYVLLAPITGYLNNNGSLEYFLFLWSIVIVLSLFIYNWLRK
jgi:MFS family permease